MTSPTVESPPVIPTTTRAHCTRAGVIAKYYRRNSGDVESSPLYSTWFREEIIADQRYERRRRLLQFSKSRNYYQEMEVEFSNSYWANKHNSRHYLRGKRQVDCKICHIELTDWAQVTSPVCNAASPKPHVTSSKPHVTSSKPHVTSSRSHVTSPTSQTSSKTLGGCVHLFHNSCYQYWRSQSKSLVNCPVCAKLRAKKCRQVSSEEKTNSTINLTANSTLDVTANSVLDRSSDLSLNTNSDTDCSLNVINESSQSEDNALDSASLPEPVIIQSLVLNSSLLTVQEVPEGASHPVLDSVGSVSDENKLESSEPILEI